MVATRHAETVVRIQKPTTNRLAWVACAILAAGVLVSVGFLLIRLRPYWIARNRPVEAKLHGASLPHAMLAGVVLCQADLSEANLAGANLRGAYLEQANLSEVNLAGGDL